MRSSAVFCVSGCWSDRTYFVLYRSIDERTLVYFADNPFHVLKAYVDSQEGLDRAGGFAVQVCYSPEPEDDDIHADGRVSETYSFARLMATFTTS